MSNAKPAPAISAPDPAEALLLGLIHECHAVMRDALAPAVREAPDRHDRSSAISDILSLTRACSELGDSVARLRRGGEEKPPEMRQRITVERVQSGAPVPILSAGEGGGV